MVRTGFLGSKILTGRPKKVIVSLSMDRELLATSQAGGED